MAIDPYLTLDIPHDADEEAINKAYKSKAQQHHPDRNPDDPFATTRFQLCTEARDILLDRERRARYDRGEDPKAHNAQAQARLMLRQVFMEALKADGPEKVVANMRRRLKGQDRAAAGEAGNIVQANTKLEAAKDEFGYKGEGENLLVQVIDDLINAHRKKLGEIKTARETLKEAHKMLGEYSDKEIQQIMFTVSSTTATGSTY